MKITKIFEKIKFYFRIKSFYEKCSEEIEDILPINSFNSSDKECLKNDFEKIIGKW